MKKFFVVMMCLIMTVCFMPAVAFAGVVDNCTENCTCQAVIGDVHYDTLDSAMSAAAAGATVKLLKNVDYSTAQCFHIDKKVTLDLNGKNITAVANGSCTVGGRATHFIRILSGGDLTLTDTSENKDGSITSTYGGKSDMKVVEVMSGAKFTLEAGKIQNDAETNYGSTTVYVRDGGTFILDGGTVAAVKSKLRSSYALWNVGITTIKKGRITSNDSTYPVSQNSTQALVINGGTVDSVNKAWISIGDKKALPVISGGQFSGTINSKWIAEGKYGVYDGTGSIIVNATPEC